MRLVLRVVPLLCGDKRSAGRWDALVSYTGQIVYHFIIKPAEIMDHSHKKTRLCAGRIKLTTFLIT